MNHEPTHDDDDILERLLLGEISFDDDEVKAMPMAEQNTLRELIALEKLVEKSGQLERAAVVTGSNSGGEKRRNPWVTRLAMVAIAAGLLLVSQALFFGPDSGTQNEPWRPGGGRLSSESYEVKLLSPLGKSESFQSFTWTAERPEEAQFRVVFQGLGTDGEWGEAQVSPLLDTAEWNPPSDLPLRIRWTVEIVQGLDVLASAPAQEAWKGE